MKKIDLSKYAVEPTEATIRQVFYKDGELRLIMFIINNHEPLTESELIKQYNKLFSTSYQKSWIFQKLLKIENFGLFEKKPYYECKPDGNAAEVKIIQKHKEWLTNQPLVFHKRYNSNVYIYLTKKGEQWIPKLEDIQERLSGGK